MKQKIVFSSNDICGTLYGGPYRDRPHSNSMFTVNMADEISDPANVRVDCVDFQIPDTDKFNRAVALGILAMGEGKAVYAGCMGGIGRTGMYAAAMAKVAGEKDPVGFTRNNFHPHAVETKEQMAFIGNLDVNAIKSLVYDGLPAVSKLEKPEHFFKRMVRFLLTKLGF